MAKQSFASDLSVATWLTRGLSMFPNTRSGAMRTAANFARFWCKPKLTFTSQMESHFSG